MKELSGKRVAILATDGFEQSELFKPYEALLNAGAEVHVISMNLGRIKGWDNQDWGESIHVDVSLDDVNPDDYDALMLPGGVINPDSLRKNEKAVEFVQSFVNDKKPIAAICHGPQTLIETGSLAGKKMTSYSSIRTDLLNAGAQWVDEEVVHDGNLITSRKPDDLPAFNKKMIEVFGQTEFSERRSVEGRGSVSTDERPSIH